MPPLPPASEPSTYQTTNIHCRYELSNKMAKLACFPSAGPRARKSRHMNVRRRSAEPNMLHRLSGRRPLAWIKSEQLSDELLTGRAKSIPLACVCTLDRAERARGLARVIGLVWRVGKLVDEDDVEDDTEAEHVKLLGRMWPLVHWEQLLLRLVQHLWREVRERTRPLVGSLGRTPGEACKAKVDDLGLHAREGAVRADNEQVLELDIVVQHAAGVVQVCEGTKDLTEQVLGGRLWQTTAVEGHKVHALEVLAEYERLPFGLDDLVESHDVWVWRKVARRA
mmetsp:Transcript_51527/g.133869  ORF Transcript_51527/g.133869 Transcript_51527/m.133869 type:complete len:281 (-) Transcript_51527:291-1133(-)